MIKVSLGEHSETMRCPWCKKVVKTVLREDKFYCRECHNVIARISHISRGARR